MQRLEVIYTLCFGSREPERASALGNRAVRAARVYSVGLCLASGRGGKAKGKAVGDSSPGEE